MAGGSTNVPPVPEFTQEEKEFFQKSNLTTEQINKLLTSQNSYSDEMSSIMKDLSGLYTTEKVAGTEKTVFDQGAADSIKNKLNLYKNQPLNDLRDKEIPSWALDVLGRAGYDVGRTYNDNNQTKGGQRNPKDPGKIFQGFIDSIKNGDASAWSPLGLAKIETTPGSEKKVINQVAVDELKGRISKFQDAQARIGLLEAENYENALKGNAPVSAATIQRKQDEFRLLKENAARSGNLITGDSPESAVGNSTAANELLGQFNKKWGLLEDSERFGQVAQGAGQSLARSGMTDNSMSLLGKGSTFSPGNAVPGYMGLLSAYQAGGQPFYNQRMAGYQQQYGQAALDSQSTASQYQLLGMLGGTLLGRYGGGLGSIGGWNGQGAGLLNNNPTGYVSPYSQLSLNYGKA